MRQRFYKPMLANTAKAPFSAKDWIFEIKWDGIRAISYVDEELSVRSRYDKELRYNFPELEELATLASHTVLDGEIIVVQKGKPDFQTLLERSRSTSAQGVEFMAKKFPALYIVFDILEKDGEPLLDNPLIERKEILKEHVKEGKNVLLSEYIEEQGEAYYEAALKKSLEGVMAKKQNSPYEPGVRSKNWLKIKKLATCDCVIFGYTKGEGRREGTLGALILGLYDDDRSVFVGKVGTGFSDKTLDDLMQTFQGLQASRQTLEDVSVPEEITWLKPELVCEVIYQSVTKDGRLRMPRFHGLREDKSPRECTLDQIKQDAVG
ncbi:MAG TPA: non-homologous end-joining DNA ligase [Candidatus Krumholzibacteriaceae bacterium]|jgi:DNA ligase D-like protein (predicted ligase)|nr:non-homologous end-joining DNA ligase [Candidatus Krumholzibacteriaceae bacterium]